MTKKPLLSRQQELSAHVANAITHWTHVEFAIGTVFANAANLQFPLAFSILRHFRSFNLLLDVCDSAVRFRVKETSASDYWRSVKSYSKELSEARNYMAHTGQVLHSAIEGNPLDAPEDLVEPRIGPPALNPFLPEKSRRDPMDVEEVKELTADFQQLFRILTEFSNALMTDTISDSRFGKPIKRRRLPRAQRKGMSSRIKTKKNSPFRK